MQRTEKCTICNNDFTFESKRGRPPVKCEICREGKIKPKKPIEKPKKTEKIVPVITVVEEETEELLVDSEIIERRDWGGPHNLGSLESPYTFSIGDRVKISGENGTYKVQSDKRQKDGSIVLYGGDPNPNGRRRYRSIMPSRLSPDKRKKFIKEV